MRTADTETTTVPSIHCSSCEDYLRSILSGLPHLRNLSVDVPQHSLTFAVDVDHDNYSSREPLVRAVQRLLDASGYVSYRVHTPIRSSLRRFANAALGTERQLHERHLAHCAACQLEQERSQAEKGEGTSLTTVKVDNPAPLKLAETRLAIEGMTCRFAISPRKYAHMRNCRSHVLCDRPRFPCFLSLISQCML